MPYIHHEQGWLVDKYGQLVEPAPEQAPAHANDADPTRPGPVWLSLLLVALLMVLCVAIVTGAAMIGGA